MRNIWIVTLGLLLRVCLALALVVVILVCFRLILYLLGTP